jgi:uncharacterized Zn-finger protein
MKTTGEKIQSLLGKGMTVRCDHCDRRFRVTGSPPETVPCPYCHHEQEIDR